MGGPMGGPPMGRPPMGRPQGNMPLKMQRPEDDFTDKEFDLEQMERESEEMVQLVELNRDNCRFTLTTGSELCLQFEGKSYEHTELVETFPFTDHYAFISVRNAEERSKELGMIVNLEKDFDEETIAIIKKHLDLRYHMPVIEHIVHVKESGGFTHFTVQTDCGKTQFSLKSNTSHVTAFTDRRLIIQDMEGNRFEIPDKYKLSARELKRLDVFM